MSMPGGWQIPFLIGGASHGRHLVFTMDINRNISQIFHKQVSDYSKLYRNFFSQKFLELEQQIFSKDRQIFPESSFSEEEFLRVAVLLRSRIHPPLTESNVALVPLADKVAWPYFEGCCIVYKLLYIAKLDLHLICSCLAKLVKLKIDQSDRQSRHQ